MSKESRIKEEISSMTIINKVDNEILLAFGYDQWVESFVEGVITRAPLKCEEVIIEDIEDSKRIFLIIDHKEYIVRTWNYYPVKRDDNDKVCAEVVEYTLLEMVDDEKGGHGLEIFSCVSNIEWKN